MLHASQSSNAQHCVHVLYTMNQDIDHSELHSMSEYYIVESKQARPIVQIDEQDELGHGHTAHTGCMLLMEEILKTSTICPQSVIVSKKQSIEKGKLNHADAFI